MRKIPFLFVLLFSTLSGEEVSLSTGTKGAPPVSPEVKKKFQEISANKKIKRPPKDELAAIISDLDFFYSMDFAVSLPVLENYEVFESTASKKMEELK